MKILVLLAVAFFTVQCAPTSGFKTPTQKTSSDSEAVGIQNPPDRPMPSPSPSPSPNNGIPSPNHTLAYGYYFTDSKYGNYQTEVDCYSDLYYAGTGPAYYAGSDTPTDEWLPLMKASVQKAVDKKKRINLAISINDVSPDAQARIDKVLNIMAKFWTSVYIIELADEPDWTKKQTEAKLQELRGILRNHGLPDKPMGIVYTQDQTLNSNAIFATGLDWVGIEAYVSAPGDANAQVNVDNLNNFINRAKARIPADKNIVMIMQAYSRNYAWTNIDTLKELQLPTYLQSYNDPRVIAINMFAYGRPSGSREYLKLTNIHKKIGNSIFGTSCR
jgi:hypothetical protein